MKWVTGSLEYGQNNVFTLSVQSSDLTGTEKNQTITV